MKIMLILLLMASNGYTSPVSIIQVREVFQKAATEENYCRSLIQALENYNELNNPLLGGYKACATMMMAKYLWNPFSKLSNFSNGKTLLEKCIIADKQNIELRFLRYSAQTKAPFFLGYRSCLKEDRSLLDKALPQLKDPGLKDMITQFLKTQL